MSESQRQDQKGTPKGPPKVTSWSMRVGKSQAPPIEPNAQIKKPAKPQESRSNMNKGNALSMSVIEEEGSAIFS